MSTVPPFQIGSAGVVSDPAIQFGNATDWTDLLADGLKSVATVTAATLGVGTSSGTLPPSSILLAVDNAGNVGIAGSLSLLGDQPATAASGSILVGSGVPTSTTATVGSLYLRTDGAAVAAFPRLYQYQFTPHGPGWIPVTVGTLIFSVRDFGATGGGTADDTAAIQAAILAASVAGGCVYFPPGIYRVTDAGTGACLTLTNPMVSVSFVGCGAASVLRINASDNQDVDILQIAGPTADILIRDLAFIGAGGGGTNGWYDKGAAINLISGSGEFHVDNVVTQNVGVGLIARGNGGAGRVTNSKIRGDRTGCFVSAGILAVNTDFKGQTYGLIADGANGVRLISVTLFGALSLATWNTDDPVWNGGSQNSIYCEAVEANYSDPNNRVYPPEGIGSASFVACQAQVHLVDCWFQTGTIVGGELPPALTVPYEVGQSGALTQNVGPFIPSDVTIQGGNFRISDHAVATITNNALELAAGSSTAYFTVSDGNYVVAGAGTGYCIYVDTSVENVSIIGNNISTKQSSAAAGGMFLGCTVGVSVQSNNLIGPPTTISIPTAPLGPFLVAGNVGFNPTGLFHTYFVSGPTATVVNTFGTPGVIYVSGGVPTVITAISVGNPGATHLTGLTSGAFPVLPGQEVTVSFTGPSPSVIFVGG